jgi:hypothetical protein
MPSGGFELFWSSPCPTCLTIPTLFSVGDGILCFTNDFGTFEISGVPSDWDGSTIEVQCNPRTIPRRVTDFDQSIFGFAKK